MNRNNRDDFAEDINASDDMNRLVIVEEEEEGDFPCNTCSFVFPEESLLLAHLKQQPKCGIATTKKTSLEQPSKSHVCPLCFRNLQAETSMESHLQKHREDPTTQLSCETCSKTFDTSKQLKLHIKLHLIKYSHTCSQCLKKFKIKKLLNINYDEKHKRHLLECFPCSQSNNSMKKMKMLLRKKNPIFKFVSIESILKTNNCKFN